MQSSTVTCPKRGQRNRVAAGGTGKPRCGKCRQWLPWIASAGDADFADVVETASVPVLVDLWAAWCGPCRMVSPALEQLAGERAGQLKLVKVDVDGAPGLSQRFEVRAVPTLLLMDHGRVLARKSGAAPVAALRSWVDESLAT
ncbi:thioredoxin [Mycobacterium sp. Y57]|uniref:thioredoxin n=1 Tax=Mycolicibacterium xanthum TaxID=2796469 RepID=UPI001C866BEA|nr:thioredoxin [Mycolicibacterium xanthum]MBX7432624.1 thioredoxin [Mycolicibacterium xanthum]